jgi:uncharacterized membrane protein YedE/YeeE
MKRIFVSFLWCAIAAAVFGAVTGAVYAFALPKLVAGPPLFVGILLAASAGGFIGYRTPRVEKLSERLSFGLLYGVVAAFMSFYLSMFIILNTRGS